MQSKDVLALFELPFTELVYRAQGVHREHHDPAAVQLSTLLSVKTGGCPEDCAYCPQSRRYETGVEDESVLPLSEVIDSARAAKAAGATRFCMGAAWRGPKDRDLDKILPMVEGVKALGLETCVTLGMLKPGQAERLREAGLDYYNHNIDTSEAHYGNVITTRSFADRLDTLDTVRQAGIKVCSGGILGLGEGPQDRVDMLVTLANLPVAPESVPINMLIPVEGTPLADAAPVDPIDFVRMIATARIMMPRSHVRLSAGRTAMSDEMQAMCFFAGANSIFVGDTLLTKDNPEEESDMRLFAKLGLQPMQAHEHHPDAARRAELLAADPAIPILR